MSSSVFYADGTRAGVIDPGTGGWISRYIGSLIYSGSNGSEALDGIQTEDGFIDCSGGVSNAQMQYFLRDHLGSVRVVAADRNTVLSRTDYLPFGARMTGNGLPESATARSAWFGFSGKENEKWDAASGTQHWLRGERWQHFGARAYDPATCIWTGIDPLAEKYPGVSPYAYCKGDPINRRDPDGEDEWEINSEGKVVNVITTTDHDAFYIVDNDGNRMVASDGSFLSISFNYKTFSFSKANSITAFLAEDVNTGADLFKFMADFTDVEQGLIIGSFGAFVFNEGSDSHIHVSAMANSISHRQEVSISRLIHSHPRSSKPSNRDGEGDIPAAQKTLSYVPRYVYLPASNKLIPYNKFGSSNPIPWKSLFPKSNY